jgi:hypothetical protein
MELNDMKIEHQNIEAQNLIERYLNGRLSEEDCAWIEMHFSECQKCQQELHRIIEDKALIQRYVLNELTGAVAEIVERHYFACDLCFEDVKAQEKLAAGIREVAAGGAFRQNDKLSRWSMLWGIFNSPKTSFAAAAVAIILVITTVYLWNRSTRLTNELHQIQKPHINISHVFLNSTRGSTIQHIEIQDQDSPFFLELDIIGEFSSPVIYGASISSETNQIIWSQEKLETPDHLNHLSILCWPGWFEYDQLYSLKIIAKDSLSGKVIAEPVHLFQIQKTDKLQ